MIDRDYIVTVTEANRSFDKSIEGFIDQNIYAKAKQGLNEFSFNFWNYTHINRDRQKWLDVINHAYYINGYSIKINGDEVVIMW